MTTRQEYKQKQLEVMRRLPMRNQQISSDLGIPLGTVEKLITEALEEYGCFTRTELALNMLHRKTLTLTDFYLSSEPLRGRGSDQS